MKKHIGKCALCRIESELSFEHIPPVSSFNSTPAKLVSADKILFDDDRMPWEVEGLPYINQQKGMGKYSLCKSCNNLTGTWYGEDYKLMSHIIDHLLQKDIDLANKTVEIKDVYPLRFIKQVISMFCSINNSKDKRIEPLRKFVLNKEEIGLDKNKYRLCMYFTKTEMTKYIPLSVISKMGEKEYNTIVLSEITAYPLGFILYFNPVTSLNYEGVDITNFADYKYDDNAIIRIPLCIKEVNDVFPEMYRSKEEILACVENNKKFEK